MLRQREIVEVGCHKRPIGLIKLAQKSEVNGRKRKFTGVDIVPLQVERTLRRLGIKELSANVSFIEGDAVREVEKFVPESKDLIFAGNLFTNSYISMETMLHMYGAVYTKALNFLIAAKKALKPKGRIVFIQSARSVDVVRQIGEEAGLKVHVVNLTEKQARESLAHYTRRVSSEKRRIRIINHLYGAKSSVKPDNLKPVAIIFRK